MRFSSLKTNKNFLFRDKEVEKIRALASDPNPKILTVYGRRRVGKSELIAQALRDFDVIKIEGLQGLSIGDQLQRAIKQLATTTKDSTLRDVTVESWFDFFELILNKVDLSQATVLYFEEVQWLANYSHEFVADLKYFWDNHLQYQQGTLVVLCGSSPTFMLNKVVNSAALYNRSQNTLHLMPFDLRDTVAYLGDRFDLLQRIDAYLTFGGIPEYLNYLKDDVSIVKGICNSSFTSDGFFVDENSRIFVSSLKSNPNYEKIIRFLAQQRFASRDSILSALNRTSGGDITDLLNELELSGFVEVFRPYNNQAARKLVRYQISDQYLQFYYRFIEPVKPDILSNSYNSDPYKALNKTQFQTWLGFQFERWCRNNHQLIAKVLGFQSVKYRHGAFFSRSLERFDPGFQWDLIFDRNDKVLTLCEVKYLKTAVDTGVAQEFQARLDKIPEKSTKGRTIEKVVIAPSGATEKLESMGFFDRIITLDDLLGG
jgi:AAA+ ATPase superfamily predicted ATPase